MRSMLIDALQRAPAAEPGREVEDLKAGAGDAVLHRDWKAKASVNTGVSVQNTN